MGNDEMTKLLHVVDTNHFIEDKSMNVEVSDEQFMNEVIELAQKYNKYCLIVTNSGFQINGKFLNKEPLFGPLDKKDNPMSSPSSKSDNKKVIQDPYYIEQMKSNPNIAHPVLSKNGTMDVRYSRNPPILTNNLGDKNVDYYDLYMYLRSLAMSNLYWYNLGSNTERCGDDLSSSSIIKYTFYVQLGSKDYINFPKTFYFVMAYEIYQKGNTETKSPIYYLPLLRIVFNIRSGMNFSGVDVVKHKSTTIFEICPYKMAFNNLVRENLEIDLEKFNTYFLLGTLGSENIHNCSDKLIDKMLTDILINNVCMSRQLTGFKFDSIGIPIWW